MKHSACRTIVAACAVIACPSLVAMGTGSTESLVIPVTVWVARDPPKCSDSHTRRASSPRPPDALCEGEVVAAQIDKAFAIANAKVVVRATLREVKGQGRKTIGASCEAGINLIGGDLFEPHSINIYLVDAPNNDMTCDEDPRLIYLGSKGSPRIPAHEMGHALSLEDLLVAPSNLMRERGAMGDVVTRGQVFRMHFHCGSFSNSTFPETPIRQGSVLSCKATWPKVCLENGGFCPDACDRPALPTNCPPLTP